MEEVLAGGIRTESKSTESGRLHEQREVSTLYGKGGKGHRKTYLKVRKQYNIANSMPDDYLTEFPEMYLFIDSEDTCV